MGRKKEKKENYLDYVFMKNPAYAWKEKEDGLVCLIIVGKDSIIGLHRKYFTDQSRARLRWMHSEALCGNS